MENYQLQNDIHVFYVTATSFPDGVMDAHKKLHGKLTEVKGRRLFGISYPDQSGKIIYKAAVEELYDGEADKYACENYIISKGNYFCKTVKNFMDHLSEVGKTFAELLKHPDLDHNGACIEEYSGEKDLRCMVRLVK